MSHRELSEEEGVPQVLEELARATTPSSLKGVRACKRCGILKTLDQFIEDGCENCPFLDMVRFQFVSHTLWHSVVLSIAPYFSDILKADNPERCNICTTAFFEGHCAVMDPRESWVAKWLRTDNFMPGVYAITVTGTLDKDIEEDLESQGHRWRCQPPES
jgi:transcription elongation factor SPT4